MQRSDRSRSQPPRSRASYVRSRTTGETPASLEGFDADPPLTSSAATARWAIDTALSGNAAFPLLEAANLFLIAARNANTTDPTWLVLVDEFDEELQALREAVRARS